MYSEKWKRKTWEKVNDIYALKKRSPDKRNFLKQTGTYELFDDVLGYNPNQISSGKKGQLVPYQNIINRDQDLYYADPNNYTRNLKTNMVVSKNGVITRTNGSGITIVIQAKVNNPKNKNAPEAWQYKVRT